jgi:hypothetical protein
VGFEREVDYFRRMLRERFQWITRACPQYVAVFTTVDDAIVACGSSRTNKLAEGPNGCGLVVLVGYVAGNRGEMISYGRPTFQAATRSACSSESLRHNLGRFRRRHSPPPFTVKHPPLTGLHEAKRAYSDDPVESTFPNLCEGHLPDFRF